jgi:hypothetical protein
MKKYHRRLLPYKCRTCGCEEFYDYSDASKIRRECKKCSVRRSGEFRVRNPQLCAAHSRARRKRNRESGVVIDYKAIYKRYAEKIKARAAVHRALKSGLLSKAPCETCGSSTVEAHHHDYSKPLDVHWLCKACHVKSHERVTA